MKFVVKYGQGTTWTFTNRNEAFRFISEMINTGYFDITLTVIDKGAA